MSLENLSLNVSKGSFRVAIKFSVSSSLIFLSSRAFKYLSDGGQGTDLFLKAGEMSLVAPPSSHSDTSWSGDEKLLGRCGSMMSPGSVNSLLMAEYTLQA